MFGSVSQGAGGDADGDGVSNFGEYVAGTDPMVTGDVFSVAVNVEDGLLYVWFLARRAEGAGYLGRQRHYALEVCQGLGSSWQSVPGYVDVNGNGQVVSYAEAAVATPVFYRGRVWLDP